MNEIIELEEEREILQKTLLISLKNGNFTEFKNTLDQSIRANTVYINHVYGDPDYKTLLDIACSNKKTAPYVRLLLEGGADVNRFNPWLGAAPIHLAVSSSDSDTVQLLAEHNDTDIYQENAAGKTAFHLAAQHEREDLIQLLQKRQAADIKLTKREILTNNPQDDIDDETNPFLPPKMSEAHMPDGSLFALLLEANYEAFAFKANEHNVKLEDNNPPFTYLQLACILGLIKFVRLLLVLNVDPNETVMLHPWKPINIAAFQGYHDIVRLILGTDIIMYDCRPTRYKFSQNILHSLLKGFNRWQRCRKKLNLESGGHRDHLQCLKLILNTISDKSLNIGARCANGLTALNYAIHSDNREMILLLLERGAYIGETKFPNKMAVQDMKPATLEYFLDRCVTYYWTISARCDKIRFNCNLLTCSYQYFNLRGSVRETKLLSAISEVPELKLLLKHPSFLVFLDFKWYVIMRKLYYTNLVFHSQFVFFISMYLLAFDYVNSKIDEILPLAYASTFWYIIFISNSIMFLKEFTQFIIYSKANKYRYVTDPTNWLEVTMTIITYIILFYQNQSVQKRAFLATIAILLSYVELILLLLNHPRMCVRIEMFKAVALNSLKFLMSYSILILAFAFSFYTLFKDTSANNTSTNTPKTNSFNNITQALFKTLLMSTGEYELSEVMINDEYGISRLIVILFIFLIPTVLFNLLNAIAVSDIQGIRNDAELVSVVARIKLIIHMEEVISAMHSFIIKLSKYIQALRGGKTRTQNNDYAQKQNYYTRYNFGATSNDTEIIYSPLSCKCSIYGPRVNDIREFSVSSFTQNAIREKLLAEIDQKEKDDTCNTTAKIAQEIATLQELCKNQETLKNTLEQLENRFQETLKDTLRKLENRFQIMEQKSVLGKK